MNNKIFIMRLHHFLTSSIIIILGIFIGYFVFSSDDNDSTQFIAKEDGVVWVTPLSMEVYLARKNSTEVIEIKTSASTTPGSTIRTSATGRALIETLNKRMVLDYDTQIVIPEENNEKVSTIVLLAGSIWSRVEKVFEQGEYFEIRTQNTVAAVRGTSFNVSVVDGKTIISVEESSVAVTPIDPISGKVLTENEILVSAGNKAVQDKNGDVVVSEITEEDRNSNWHQFNASLQLESETTVTFKEDINEEMKEDIKPVETKEIMEEEITEINEDTETQTDTTTEEESISEDSSATEPVLPEGRIALASINPSDFKVGSTESITLRGLGLLHLSVLAIGREQVNPVVVSDFKIENDTTVTFTLPEGLESGVYDVVGISDMEYGSTLSGAITIR